MLSGEMDLGTLCNGCREQWGNALGRLQEPLLQRRISTKNQRVVLFSFFPPLLISALILPNGWSESLPVGKKERKEKI